MTNEQLIEKFNPANAGMLSAEDTEIMRNLSDEQIDALANAYPNQPTRRSYLRLYDKSVTPEKQLYQLSTWQNLRNVRKFSNRKNLIAWDFLTSATKFNNAQRPAPSHKASTQSPKKVIVDLTAQEAAAELQNLVDKNQKTAAPSEPVKPQKPASSPKKGKAKAEKSAPPAVVENLNTPADQQFTDGQ